MMSKPGAANGPQIVFVSCDGVDDHVAGIDVMKGQAILVSGNWCHDLDRCLRRYGRDAPLGVVKSSWPWFVRTAPGDVAGTETRRPTIVERDLSSALLTPSGTFVTLPRGSRRCRSGCVAVRGPSTSAVVPTPAPLPIVKFPPTPTMVAEIDLEAPLPNGMRSDRMAACVMPSGILTVSVNVTVSPKARSAKSGLPWPRCVSGRLVG